MSFVLTIIHRPAAQDISTKADAAYPNRSRSRLQTLTEMAESSSGEERSAQISAPLNSCLQAAAEEQPDWDAVDPTREMSSAREDTADRQSTTTTTSAGGVEMDDRQDNPSWRSSDASGTESDYDNLQSREVDSPLSQQSTAAGMKLNGRPSDSSPETNGATEAKLQSAVSNGKTGETRPSEHLTTKHLGAPSEQFAPAVPQEGKSVASDSGLPPNFDPSRMPSGMPPSYPQFFSNPFVPAFMPHLPQNVDGSPVDTDESTPQSQYPPSGPFQQHPQGMKQNPYTGGYFVHPQYFPYGDVMQQYVQSFLQQQARLQNYRAAKGASPASEAGEVIYDDTAECAAEDNRRPRSKTPDTARQSVSPSSAAGKPTGFLPPLHGFYPQFPFPFASQLPVSPPDMGVPVTDERRSAVDLQQSIGPTANGNDVPVDSSRSDRTSKDSSRHSGSKAPAHLSRETSKRTDSGISPATTDCDSESRSDFTSPENSPAKSLRSGKCPPPVEDGFSGDQASDSESEPPVAAGRNRPTDHPAMMLIKKQINEIEKEIVIKSKNQNLKKMDPKELEAFIEMQHLEQRQFELFCERFGEISGMTNGAGGIGGGPDMSSSEAGIAYPQDDRLREGLENCNPQKISLNEMGRSPSEPNVNSFVGPSLYDPRLPSAPFPYGYAQNFMSSGYAVPPQFYPQGNFVPYGPPGGFPPQRDMMPPSQFHNFAFAPQMSSPPDESASNPQMFSQQPFGAVQSSPYVNVLPSHSDGMSAGLAVRNSPFTNAGNAVAQHLLAQLQHQQQIAASGGTGNVSHLANSYDSVNSFTGLQQRIPKSSSLEKNWPNGSHSDGEPLRGVENVRLPNGLKDVSREVECRSQGSTSHGSAESDVQETRVEDPDQPVWVQRESYTRKVKCNGESRPPPSTDLNNSCSSTNDSASRHQEGHAHDSDTDNETDRLLGLQRLQQQEASKQPAAAKKKPKKKEVIIHEPAVLIEGVLFRAHYLGSTQLICEGRPTKASRMMQAQEAVSRIKAPDGETQPTTDVDLFISTEKIMVLNTDLQKISDTDVKQDIMMDHPLRSISYIADIGDLVVLMARRVSQGSPDSPEGAIRRTPKIICHVFESDEAQFIAQSIGQAFQVAYMEFLRQNGIDDPGYFREIDYQEVLNAQEIFGDELEMFARKETQKDVVVPKQKGEILGIVIVESGWGSMLPTVVIANLMPGGPAARCNQLNIGDQIINVNGISLVGLPLLVCQNTIKNMKNVTAVRLTVVHTPPVVEVRIKRPDTKYQLGFSVQNGVICSLLRGGIAERGGVRVGHRIIEINGQSVVAVAHEKIVTVLATAVGEIQMKTMPTSMFRLLTGQETPNYI